MKKYFAELIGTMVLVLIGCGSAVFAGVHQGFESIGTLGVAFAFGLSVVAMAYTIGKISGCHINPAITLAMLIDKRISKKDAAMYMLFQTIGAIAGSVVLFLLIGNIESSTTYTGANGYTNMPSALIAEIVFTFIFVLVVLGSTSKGAENNLAGLVIGLTLVMVHIVCIPITGTSVNPARSIGPALFEGVEALKQLWLFIVAPFIGAALAAIVWRMVDVGNK